MADSTQFLIDIAAKLTGGQASVTQLSDLGDRMLAAGASAKDLEATYKTASAAVEESAAALELSNSALSEAERKYKQAEIAADRAAKAVERLNESGKSGEKFAAKQAAAVEKSNQLAAALKAEAASLDAVRSKASAADAGHTALTKGLANVKSAAEKAKKAEDEARGTGSLRQLAAGLSAIGGPAGIAGERIARTGEAFEKMGASLGSMGPYVAAAVAIIAIGTAALAAAVGITKWGVAMADAQRSESLLYAGIARSTAGGEQLEETITNLGNVVPQTRDELRNMAGELAQSGLRGKALSNALESAAVKAAQLKWGPDFQKQLLSMDVQTQRFHDNIAGTFGGLKIEGLLGGMQTLVALFDSSTSSGKALKFLFETLFQPIVDAVSDAMPKVERFFLYGEILALKAFIALKPYRGIIEDVGKAFLVGAGIIGGILLYSVVALIAAVAEVVAIVGALAYGLYKLGELIVTGVAAAFNWLTGKLPELVDIGKKIIEGLVAGITGDGQAVIEAISGVVDDAIKMAKRLLGIASPSAVFAGIGGFTAQGFAEGVEGGSGDARSALEDLVAPPKGKDAAGSSSTQVGGVTVNITVDGHGQTDDGLAAKIAAAVRDVFESDALMLGAGEAPA